MQRDAVLRKRLHELNIDGILITDLDNLKYITEFTGSSGFLIITKKDAIFATDFRYKEQAGQEVKGFRIIAETKDRIETIKEITNKYKIKRLGFEDHSVSYRTYRKLLKHKIKLKALSHILEDLRLIKSRKEISYIKTAIHRAESAFKNLLPFIKVGVTEQGLAIKLEALLKEEGCKTIPFGVIVASGLMSALPHARPTNKKLKKGDIVLFDWGGECEGYFSDMTRMVAIKGKKGTGRQFEIYSVVLNAQESAIKSIKDGVDAVSIDKAARDIIRRGGYVDYFGHGTGHGIGLSVHERPNISWRSKEKIRKGMVFTVEPGIYLPGKCGVRIEDMVMVTKNSADVLTTLPKKLYIINS